MSPAPKAEGKTPASNPAHPSANNPDAAIPHKSVASKHGTTPPAPAANLSSRRQYSRQHSSASWESVLDYIDQTPPCASCASNPRHNWQARCSGLARSVPAAHTKPPALTGSGPNVARSPGFSNPGRASIQSMKPPRGSRAVGKCITPKTNIKKPGQYVRPS